MATRIEEASSPNGRQPRAVVQPELGVSRIYWRMRYQGPEQRLARMTVHLGDSAAVRRDQLAESGSAFEHRARDVAEADSSRGGAFLHQT